ncbi:MAG TPA: hypothetical protein VGV38_21275, partial [Pyrinomonadaceae bacterium]|nr:hypothetical protein [Pyrinomonadaceae bacterium]
SLSWGARARTHTFTSRLTAEPAETIAMQRRGLTILSLLILLPLSAERARAQQFDIGSGGLPTITGARGGSVTGSADVTQSLVVNVDFGELSPVNTSNLVVVTVPVSVRSTSPYQVSVTLSGNFAADPQAVQRTDIGFGALNLRSLGAKARNCNGSPHLFRAPFNNHPATAVTLDAQGRAAYPSTLANLGASAVILSGPELTKGNSVTRREEDNGYVFDAVLVIKPQFYSSGRFNATLTFQISAGPNVQC